MIDKLTLVTVGDIEYLCELHETGDETELRNAWPMSGQKPLGKWISRQNLGELKTIKVSRNAGYTVTPLDMGQKRNLERRWADMCEVKRTALRRLENQYFWDN